MTPGKIIGVNLSIRKGTKKTNVGAGYLIADHGLQGDAHAGTDRQVSLFPAERAEELAAGLGIVVQPGDFAENITVRGINLKFVYFAKKTGQTAKRPADPSCLFFTQFAQAFLYFRQRFFQISGLFL